MIEKTLKEIVVSLPLLPERADDTNDQLADLHAIAARLGMQNAADYIRAVLVMRNVWKP